MSTRYIYGSTRPVLATIATGQAATVGDMVGMSSNTLVRAEDVSWNSTLLATQRDFVKLFLGIVAQTKDTSHSTPYGNSQANRIRVDADGVFEFDTASASYNVGDLVGPAKQSGNALESQKVAAVATEDAAIGRVIEATSSSTRVKVQVLSAFLPAARQNNYLAPGGATIAAVTENSTSIGGSQDGNFATLTLAWNGSTDPTAAEGNLLIDAIRETAKKLNDVIAALKAQGVLASS